jgi:hypothetical protein
VRRAGEIALVVLQWLLMLWGVALIALSLLEYNAQAEMQQGLLVSGFESSLNAPPIHRRLVQGVTFGLAATGLGVTIFHLRRLYLLRRQ